MPRDATATKQRLLRAAERLFAKRGVDRVTVREINQLAGQRNASALHYHFRSREGLLLAILRRHQEEMEVLQQRMLEELEARGALGDLRALVEAVVYPTGAKLRTRAGRDYLRIVPQLIERVGIRVGRELPTDARSFQRILLLLDRRLAHLPEPVRRERIGASILFVTAALAERARRVEDKAAVRTDDETFLANLVDMAVAALDAPWSAGRRGGARTA